MASKLEILIEATLTGRGFTDAKRRLDGLEQGSSKAKESAKALQSSFAAAGGAAVAFGVAVSQAYQIAKEGAGLQQAQQQFDNLAMSIDSTSDAMLDKLRKATKGLVTDAGLVASASQIINLGLGKTEDQVVRLATVVGGLGVDMDILTLTLANQSTMRLDSLGLSIEGVTQKQKELQAQGMSTADAFNEAVISGLEEKMILLGDASETTAGSMQILETATKNAIDTIKIAFADAIAPTVKITADLINLKKEVAENKVQAQDMLASYVTLGNEFDTVAKRSREIERQLQAQFGEAVQVERGIVKLNGVTVIYAESLADMSQELSAASFDNFRRSVEVATSPVRQISGITDELNDKLAQSDNRLSFVEMANRRMANAVDENAKAVSDFEFVLSDASLAINTTQQRLREASTTNRRFFDSTNTARNETDEFTTALFDAIAAQTENANRTIFAGQALGVFSDEAAEAAFKAAATTQKINELAGQFAAGRISIFDAKTALDAFRNSLDAIPEQKNITISVGANISGSAQDILNQFGRGAFQPISDVPSGGQFGTTNNNNVSVNINAPITPSMGNLIGSDVANQIGQGAR